MNPHLVPQITTHRVRQCLGCRNHLGPFVNTKIPDGGLGEIHLCKRCAVLVGRCVGMVEEEAAQKLAAGYEDELRAAQHSLKLVEAERDEAIGSLDRLAEDVARKVASNLIDLDAERAKRRPKPGTAA